MRISIHATLAFVVGTRLTATSPPTVSPPTVDSQDSESESDHSVTPHVRTPTPENGEPYVPWHYLSNGTVVMRDVFREEQPGHPLPPMDTPDRLADAGRCPDPPFSCTADMCAGRHGGAVPAVLPPYRCTNERPFLSVRFGRMIILAGCRCCPVVRCTDPTCDAVEANVPSARTDVCRSETLRGCPCERERKPVVHSGPAIWVDEKGMQWVRGPPDFEGYDA